MIESLTEEQKAKFPEYVRRWTDIGLSTGYTDKPRAEAAIHKVYQCARLKPPKAIIWSGSPQAQQVLVDSLYPNGYALLRNRQPRDSVWDSVRYLPWLSAKSSVQRFVDDSVWNLIRTSISPLVWRSVVFRVRNTLLDVLCYPKFNELSSPVIVFGNHEVDVLSFYSYLREELGFIEETESMVGLMDLAEHCGWIIPFRDVCYASERHTTLKLNAEVNLDCEDGPAIAYPDGWGIWATDGVILGAKYQ